MYIIHICDKTGTNGTPLFVDAMWKTSGRNFPFGYGDGDFVRKIWWRPSEI